MLIHLEKAIRSIRGEILLVRALEIQFDFGISAYFHEFAHFALHGFPVLDSKAQIFREIGITN
jgi:hypothetical protein